MDRKTRNEVILECANAATACWQHYGQKLPSEIKENLCKVLDTILPAYQESKEWREYADEYDRSVTMQDERNTPAI